MPDKRSVGLKVISSRIRRRRAAHRQLVLRRAGAVVAVTALVATIAAVLLLAAGASRPVTAAVATPAAYASRTAPRPRTVPHRQPPTSFAIAAQTLQIEEPSSAAIATNRVDGRPVRALPTLLLYPTTGSPGQPGRSHAAADVGAEPFPLIVFSQGFDEPVSGYRAMLDAWARAGYVVAAPTYPRTAPTAPGGVDENDVVNHPADLRFVISTLVSEAKDARRPLAGLVNARQIAIAGQSDGAAVTLAAAANTCCRVGAVKAAVILSGAELSAFGGAYYTSGSVPLLVTQGDRDPINLPGCSVALYDQAPAPKYYVDLLGAEHLPPYTRPGRTRRYVVGAVVAFLDDYLQGNRSPLQRMLRKRGIPKVATLSRASKLMGQSTYCP
jgi:dienelactone hydrolase